MYICWAQTPSEVWNTARFSFFPVSCWLTAILNVLKISLLFWSFYMLVLWCESTWRNVGFVNIRQEYIEFLCCNKCVRLITVMLLLSFCVVHLCFCLLCVFLLSLLAVIVHTCVLLRLLHPCVFLCALTSLLCHIISYLFPDLIFSTRVFSCETLIFHSVCVPLVIPVFISSYF